MSTELTRKLIEQWLTYRSTKKAEELAEPEWKSLERSYMKHLEWRFGYPAKVFGQQVVSAWIITILVLLLVLAGVIFSFVQLYWAISVGDLSSLDTELAVKTAGEVSFRSSLVGGTVLVVSLVFFYLYLVHVFRIKHPVPPHVPFPEEYVAKVLGKVEQRGESDAKEG